MNKPFSIWMMSLCGMCSCNTGPVNPEVTTQKPVIEKSADSAAFESQMAWITEEETMLSDSGYSEDAAALLNPGYEEVRRWFVRSNPMLQTIFLKQGVWQTVTSTGGTEITINTSEFEGIEMSGGRLRLHILELLDKASMLQAGAQTICNQRPLESLGALYLSLSDGKRLFQLRQGSTVWVKFPKTARGNFGVFYSKLDRFGRMISESGKQLLYTTKGLKRDGFSHEFEFNADSMSGATIRLFRIKGPGLKWLRQISTPDGLEFEDSIDYPQFSQFIFETINVKTRSFLIPVGQKMIPLENINGAIVRYGTAADQGTLEIHFTQSGQQDIHEFTVEEYKPAALKQLGWVQFSRFLGNSDLCEVPYSTSEFGGITAGMVFMICKKTNTILMNPWLPVNEGLEPGSFSNIPAGLPVLLVAVIKKDGALLAGSTEFTTGSMNPHPLNFGIMPANFELQQFLNLP